MIEYTSLDKLGYRCKDDLSTVTAVAGLVLDPYGVDTWSPHVLWLSWAPLLLHRLAEDRSWAPGAEELRS